MKVSKKTVVDCGSSFLQVICPSLAPNKQSSVCKHYYYHRYSAISIAPRLHDAANVLIINITIHNHDFQNHRSIHMQETALTAT